MLLIESINVRGRKLKPYKDAFFNKMGAKFRAQGVKRLNLADLIRVLCTLLWLDCVCA